MADQPRSIVEEIAVSIEPVPDPARPTSRRRRTTAQAAVLPVSATRIHAALQKETSKGGLATTAMSKKTKKMATELVEMQLLLPWHAAGTLKARDADRIDGALARHPELARQYEAILGERTEVVHLNEGLGAPSTRIWHKLLAALEGKPPRGRSARPKG